MVKMKKKLTVIVALCLILSLTGCKMIGGFDAAGYTEAVLDQNLKGDVKEAKDRMEGVTEKELKTQYEERIASFVDQTLISGVQVDDQLKSKYTQVCKRIFKDLKYEVKQADKINKSLYEVKVEMQPADVFQTFQAAVKTESEKLVTKAKNGEYKGTEDEITQQMEKEFVDHAYQLLVTSYDNMKFQEKETFVFHVTKEDGKAFMIKEEELSSFILQILHLDKIQD